MTPSEAIAVLVSLGLTETAIGEAVGTRQSTINRIKRGDMVPNWATGKALIDLALERKAAAEADAAPELKNAA